MDGLLLNRFQPTRGCPSLIRGAPQHPQGHGPASPHSRAQNDAPETTPGRAIPAFCSQSYPSAYVPFWRGVGAAHLMTFGACSCAYSRISSAVITSPRIVTGLQQS